MFSPHPKVRLLVQLPVAFVFENDSTIVLQVKPKERYDLFGLISP